MQLERKRLQLDLEEANSKLEGQLRKNSQLESKLNKLLERNLHLSKQVQKLGDNNNQLQKLNSKLGLVQSQRLEEVRRLQLQAQQIANLEKALREEKTAREMEKVESKRAVKELQLKLEQLQQKCKRETETVIAEERRACKGAFLEFDRKLRQVLEAKDNSLALSQSQVRSFKEDLGLIRSKIKQIILREEGWSAAHAELVAENEGMRREIERHRQREQQLIAAIASFRGQIVQLKNLAFSNMQFERQLVLLRGKLVEMESEKERRITSLAQEVRIMRLEREQLLREKQRQEQREAKGQTRQMGSQTSQPGGPRGGVIERRKRVDNQ